MRRKIIITERPGANFFLLEYSYIHFSCLKLEKEQRLRKFFPFNNFGVESLKLSLGLSSGMITGDGCLVAESLVVCGHIQSNAMQSKPNE